MSGCGSVFGPVVFRAVVHFDRTITTTKSSPQILEQVCLGKQSHAVFALQVRLRRPLDPAKVRMRRIPRPRLVKVIAPDLDVVRWQQPIGPFNFIEIELN